MLAGKVNGRHCLVSLHGHSNGISLPLDFKSYLSEEFCDEQNGISFKSKPELAIDILKNIELQREKEGYVLVDSWYTVEKFINESQKLGFQVIGAVKSNRIFYPDGIRDKLKEFANKIDKDTLDVVTVKDVKHHFYRYEGPIKGIENIVILIIWQKKDGELIKPFYLACTNTALTSKEIIEYYGYRWEIEVSFRYEKQRLGLEDYEMRSFKGIERFWSLVYLIYNFLEIKRYKSRIKETIGSILEKLKLQKKVYFIGYIYDEVKEGKSKEELLLKLGIPV